jgi:hypothetical protein
MIHGRGTPRIRIEHDHRVVPERNQLRASRRTRLKITINDDPERGRTGASAS